jgi:hypothetical protein
VVLVSLPLLLRDCGGDRSDRRNVWSEEAVVVVVGTVPFPGVRLSVPLPLLFFPVAVALALAFALLLLVRFPSGVRPGLIIFRPVVLGLALLLLTGGGGVGAE